MEVNVKLASSKLSLNNGDVVQQVPAAAAAAAGSDDKQAHIAIRL